MGFMSVALHSKIQMLVQFDSFLYVSDKKHPLCILSNSVQVSPLSDVKILS